MEILRNVNDAYVSMLGINPVDATKSYRWNKLITSVDIDDGKVMFNGLTRAIIFLKNTELESICDIKTYAFLYRAYFLVDKDFDEYAELRKMRTRLQTPVDDLYLSRINRYTVVTTLACNARCKYCYEAGIKSKKSMTNATALKIAEYIVNHSDGNNTITLDWFGGEPLVNTKVIDLITNYLATRNFSFVSTIISNGYLLDEKMVKKAKNNWHLQGIQITLDGTEDVYNSIKNYVSAKESPYKRVLNNIKLLLKNGIQVSVRLNVGEENGDNLLELIDELNLTFGARSGLQIYCRALFDSDGSYSEEKNKRIYAYINAIESKLQEYEFEVGKFCGPEMMLAQCMADDGSSILIEPNGKIGTCEHYLDSDFFGDINTSNREMQVLKDWHDYLDDLDICKDCSIYADCLRPKKCVELMHCDAMVKQNRIDNYKTGLKRFYLDYRMYNMLPNALML
jgi:uncharacterized protein